MTKLKKIAGEKLLKDKAFRTWYDGQSKEYLKKLYNTTKNKNVKKALLRLNNDAVRAARKATVQSTGKFLGGKALGIAGLVLGATETATADQPEFPKGSAHYQDPKKKINFTTKNTKKKLGGFRDTFLEPGIESID